MTDLPLILTPLSPSDLPAIERMDARAFGPGRFARTAYRLREQGQPDFALSYVARVATFLVGANRITPVACGDTPLLLLGPLTVDPDFRSRGIGAALPNRSLDTARAAGHGGVILVGDEPYYARFGFKRVPQGKLTLPGPFNPQRLLAYELIEGYLANLKGLIRSA